MELHEALSQITHIRRQLAHTEQFRGYRAAPVACSGLLACLAGLLQSFWITEPAAHLAEYLILWIAVAVLSFAICLGEVWRGYHSSTGLLHQQTTRLALAQFFPCLVAGCLLTIVVAAAAPQVAWMLPGLWGMLFSLGVFASWRLLPRGVFLVAIYYLASSSCALAWGSGTNSFSAWTMPLLFGVGQLLSAAVLLMSERSRFGSAP